jgi:hypothetical protein
VVAGTDREAGAGDVAGLVRGEEQDGVGDVHRLDPGSGKRFDRLENRHDCLTGDPALVVVGQEDVAERLLWTMEST